MLVPGPDVAATGIKVIDAVAIDGPVASGKTTVGRMVAERLDYAFLDTGLMYRAATWSARRHGVGMDDDGGLSRIARTMRLTLDRTGGDARLLIDDFDATDELRTPEIDRHVSAVSEVHAVRQALVPQQRSIAEEGPIVMVGRDIGTVVLPDAATKIFLEASVEVRAKRRLAELTDAGFGVELRDVILETARRDRVDSEREDSPLRPSPGALVIHTDQMSRTEVADRIVLTVRGR